MDISTIAQMQGEWYLERADKFLALAEEQGEKSVAFAELSKEHLDTKEQCVALANEYKKKAAEHFAVARYRGET